MGNAFEMRSSALHLAELSNCRTIGSRVTIHQYSNTLLYFDYTQKNMNSETEFFVKENVYIFLFARHFAMIWNTFSFFLFFFYFQYSNNERTPCCLPWCTLPTTDWGDNTRRRVTHVKLPITHCVYLHVNAVAVADVTEETTDAT